MPKRVVSAPSLHNTILRPVLCFLPRNVPHADGDDSCSVDSDPEAKVCKKDAFQQRAYIVTSE